MSDILEGWYQRAAANLKRVVLADVGDARVSEAARVLSDRALVFPLLLDGVGPSDAVVDFASGREKIDLADPFHVGAAMVAVGEADACIAGASRPTSEVIRAAIRCLGVAEGVSTISSSFLFILPDGTSLAYGDCGVIPDPDVNQMASIAVSTAATYRALTGEEPRVAMLSFSTKGSAEHPRVDKVRAATAQVRGIAPGLAVDGELQFDAAFVPAVGASKAQGSAVAGSANVFVFPDLDSANIAYKITERLGGAKAFGPLLQGVGAVMHDLSRGCSSDDIVNVAVIAALQAQTQ
ncbi:MAG: phosphate acyltransferase [Actinomycetota bacterium]|nr:phosphate acyltransferase [Actinomycetota bacterium]